MPDWSLSLAVLILGLIGLVLGSAGVHRAIGASVHWFDRGYRHRFTPWLALVAMLPVLAVTLQAVGAGANTLGLGAIISVHVLGVLLAIGHRSTIHSPCRLPSRLSPTPLPQGERGSAESVHRPRSRAWSLVGAAGLVWGLALNGDLGRSDGAVLVLLCLFYLTWMSWATRQSNSPGDDSESQAPAVDAERRKRPACSWRRILGLVARVCVGLTLLAMGARVLVMGALDLALVRDLDHWTLGLTLLAPAAVLAGWLPIRLAKRRPSDGASRTGWPDLWFDFNLVNLLGLVGLTALTTTSGLAFTRETLLVSWPLVILTSILAAAALIRADPA